MDVQIKTHGFKLSDSMREYIDSHTSKLDRVNERITDAKLEVREEPTHRDGERFVAQFTIVTKRAILRAEERGVDLRVTVDAVIDKMNRQIHRFHDRKIARHRRDAVGLGVLAANESAELEEPAEEQADDRQVARTKTFKVHPMDVLEAVEQLELLGHDFFVFFNADTSQMSVLYRRKDGQYGLIVPELA